MRARMERGVAGVWRKTFAFRAVQIDQRIVRNIVARGLEGPSVFRKSKR